MHPGDADAVSASYAQGRRDERHEKARACGEAYLIGFREGQENTDDWEAVAKAHNRWPDEEPKRALQMSCPTCEAVREVIEVRHMHCTVCHEEFDTPEQLDASLCAERKGAKK